MTRPSGHDRMNAALRAKHSRSVFRLGEHQRCPSCGHARDTDEAPARGEDVTCPACHVGVMDRATRIVSLPTAPNPNNAA